MNDPRRWGAEPPGSNSIPSLGGRNPLDKIEMYFANTSQ